MSRFNFREPEWYTEMPKGSHFGWCAIKQTMCYKKELEHVFVETRLGFYHADEKRWELFIPEGDFIFEDAEVFAWMPVRMPEAPDPIGTSTKFEEE